VSDPDLLVREAGRELVAFHNGDEPASGLAQFVSRYFPRLKAHAAGGDLLVENGLSERLYIRRDPRSGHGGWTSRMGSESYRVSWSPDLLDAGGGARRDSRKLIEHIASFNNR
jgi:hypothetical protein